MRAYHALSHKDTPVNYGKIVNYGEMYHKDSEFKANVVTIEDARTKVLYYTRIVNLGFEADKIEYDCLVKEFIVGDGDAKNEQLNGKKVLYSLDHKGKVESIGIANASTGVVDYITFEGKNLAFSSSCPRNRIYNKKG